MPRRKTTQPSENPELKLSRIGEEDAPTPSEEDSVIDTATNPKRPKVQRTTLPNGTTITVINN